MAGKEKRKIKNEEKETVKKEDKKVKISKETKKTSLKAVKKESGIKKWFKEVMAEFKKVRWPNKKEMIKYSIATVVFIIFFALFFYVIELIIYFIREVM